LPPEAEVAELGVGVGVGDSTGVGLELAVADALGVGEAPGAETVVVGAGYTGVVVGPGMTGVVFAPAEARPDAYGAGAEVAGESVPTDTVRCPDWVAWA
jgi:hypothetical protein